MPAAKIRKPRRARELGALLLVVGYLFALALPAGLVFWWAVERDSCAVPTDIPAPLDEWAKARLLEQYRAARAEITQRIDFQNSLTFYRLGLCGALLTFVLSSSLREVVSRWLGLPIVAARTDRGQSRAHGVRARFDGAYVATALWLATLMSAILDIQLAFNDSIIRRLGKWTLCYFEVAGGRIPGWERCFCELDTSRWHHAQWASYSVTALLVVGSLCFTWLALRRRLLATRPWRLELAITSACVVAVAAAIGYGSWIHVASR